MKSLWQGPKKRKPHKGRLYGAGINWIFAPTLQDGQLCSLGGMPWAWLSSSQQMVWTHIPKCGKYKLEYHLVGQKNISQQTEFIIHDRKSKSYVLIDVSVPDDKNIALKEAEKIASTRIWRSKITNEECENQGRPGGRRSTRKVEKDFTKGVELIPGRPKFSEIQKISLLDTAHILRKLFGWITKSYW